MTKLPLDQIRTDGGTQPRIALDFNVVNQYMDDMLRGDIFPPVSVFYDGTGYWLADGFHRHQAAWQGELPEISVKVHQGSREDAIWFSFAVNREHGLRRSQADLKRIIEAALGHPKSAGMSDNAIAKYIGCAQTWVSEVHRKSFPEPHLSGTAKIDSRTVTRNGTTYQQNVSNIGKRVDMTQSPAGGSNTLHAVEKPAVTVVAQSETFALLNGVCALGEHKISATEFVSLVPAEHRKRLYENALQAVEFLTFACEQMLKRGVA